MTETKVRAVRPRAVRPHDSAALILIEGLGRKNPKILLGKRHPSLKFMPGKFVFPGGRLEPGDRRMNIAGPLDVRVEARLLKGRKDDDPTFARALALTAIRETFEETGLVVGVGDYGGPEKPPAAWRDYAHQNCLPDLQGLHFIARAITPPFLPRRFDTRFFALDARAVIARIDGVAHAEAELVELVWTPLDEADGLDMADVTRSVLGELRARLAAGMSPFLPTPFYHFSRGNWRREDL
ncbi:NUDIX hydrolase [Rhodoblastus sp.]|uniref:NUDIX hydrolase n=1 Tax=Rhodoblastus sp. TaxID=1962975 RepID=UPI00261F3FCC|nr:NUDIX hydrolase [Rhodoblastus sp.]